MINMKTLPDQWQSKSGIRFDSLSGFTLSMQQNAIADPDYIATREKIKGSHIRVLFPDRLKQACQLIHQRPDLLPNVGIIKALRGGVLLCSAVFGAFLGVRLNSINVNVNMRQHGFVRDVKYDTHQALRDLGVTDHACYGFTWSHWTHVGVQRAPRIREQALPAPRGLFDAMFCHWETNDERTS